MFVTKSAVSVMSVVPMLLTGNLYAASPNIETAYALGRCSFAQTVAIFEAHKKAGKDWKDPVVKAEASEVSKRYIAAIASDQDRSAFLVATYGAQVESLTMQERGNSIEQVLDFLNSVCKQAKALAPSYPAGY